LAGVVLAAGTEIRVLLSYALPVFALILAWPSPGRGRLSRAAALLLFLGLFFTARAAIHAQLWNPERLAVAKAGSHHFWHPIWCGFGEFPNDYGFAWSDRAAADFVRLRDPSASYGSKRYNRILRDHVLQTVSDHPIWVAGVFAKRLFRLGSIWIEYFPGGSRDMPVVSWLFMICAVAGGLAFSWRDRNGAFFALLAVFLPEALSPVLIYSSHAFYNVGVYLCLSLLLAYALLGAARLVRARILGFQR
jgi:hypothetical protein